MAHLAEGDRLIKGGVGRKREVDHPHCRAVRLPAPNSNAISAFCAYGSPEAYRDARAPFPASGLESIVSFRTLIESQSGPA